MRPKIPDGLAKRIEDVYEEAGYATESEFIRDAIRRRLEAVDEDVEEHEGIAEYEFEYEFATVDGSTKKQYPTLYLRPEGAHVSKSEEAENTLLLHIGSKAIQETVLNSKIEELNFVHTAALTPINDDGPVGSDDDDGYIYIVFEEGKMDTIDLDDAVQRLLETTATAIQEAESWESPRQQLSNALRRHMSE